ncbi:hypothetical protein [Pararhizobium sp. DWP3-4]
MEFIIGKTVEAVIGFIVVNVLRVSVWIKRQLQPKPKYQLFFVS